jgi:hypothetical protein
MCRVESELNSRDRCRIGVDTLQGGDLGDPSREVDVPLGHPFDNVLGARVVAVHGVLADQLEIEVPIPHRHPRMVTDRVTRLPTAATNRTPAPKSPTTYRACSP